MITLYMYTCMSVILNHSCTIYRRISLSYSTKFVLIELLAQYAIYFCASNRSREAFLCFCNPGNSYIVSSQFILDIASIILASDVLLLDIDLRL